MNINGIVFHWTAGRYDQVFDDYHYNITYNPKTKKAEVVKTCEDDSETKAHTWHRNPGRIGISLCSAFEATTENMGEFPPVDVQIETACALAGKLAHIYSIKKEEIKTHAEWALVDGYGPHSGDPETRWDLWLPNWKNTGKNLSYFMKDKTLWYKEQYTSHVDNSDNLFKPVTIELVNGEKIYLPSILRFAKEAHLVTSGHQKFKNTWPSSFRDSIAEHYNLSQNATNYSMVRDEPWCPSGEGGSQYGQGSNGKPPEFEEGWYMCMNWKKSPKAGTRFIIRNPVNGKKVVAIAGYETGPGFSGGLRGGACEEIHHYLGTGHGSKLEVGVAKDQTLKPGPIT